MAGAIEALMLVVELGGPTMFARIRVMRALNPGVAGVGIGPIGESLKTIRPLLCSVHQIDQTLMPQSSAQTTGFAAQYLMILRICTSCRLANCLKKCGWSLGWQWAM